MSKKYVAEPFRIKMVEPLRMLSREERVSIIKEANYNLFAVRAEDVYIDLLTDSGTNAMSHDQWAGLMRGDESYACASSYYRFIETLEDIFGYGWYCPTHQGRAAEKILLPLLLKKGKYAISNMFFDTTRAHVELAGARAIDCVVKEATNPSLRAPFKGNMDIVKLREIINEKGADNIGAVVMTVTNNSAGGQPVSIRNMEDVSEICKEFKIPLIIDAARYAENAYFIKRDEAEYKESSMKDIVKKLFSFADYFTMSAKKDGIVNMGGVIGVKDPEDLLINRIRAGCISYEGFYTYGGLNGRDLEAIAIGLNESLDESYLNYRVGQMEYLAARLDEADIAYQAPVGGHGVFVDAAAMFPHIPYYEFPGQVLGVELYIEAGIRTSEIGSYMLGNDPDTNEQLQATFEFSRLAIPRRVYTQAHLDVVADALISIKQRANECKRGYRIIWEPPILRHFQAHLEPIIE